MNLLYILFSILFLSSDSFFILNKIKNNKIFYNSYLKFINNRHKTIKNPKSGIEVTSPIIGTAYHSPEPGAKKFVEVGKKIKKGDTIMIVEAMKTMNHVPSTADGVVKEICV